MDLGREPEDTPSCRYRRRGRSGSRRPRGRRRKQKEKMMIMEDEGAGNEKEFEPESGATYRQHRRKIFRVVQKNTSNKKAPLLILLVVVVGGVLLLPLLLSSIVDCFSIHHHSLLQVHDYPQQRANGKEPGHQAEVDLSTKIKSLARSLEAADTQSSYTAEKVHLALEKKEETEEVKTISDTQKPTTKWTSSSSSIEAGGREGDLNKHKSDHGKQKRSDLVVDINGDDDDVTSKSMREQRQSQLEKRQRVSSSTTHRSLLEELRGNNNSKGLRHINKVPLQAQVNHHHRIPLMKRKREAAEELLSSSLSDEVGAKRLSSAGMDNATSTEGEASASSSHVNDQKQESAAVQRPAAALTLSPSVQPASQTALSTSTSSSSSSSDEQAAQRRRQLLAKESQRVEQLKQQYKTNRAITSDKAYYILLTIYSALIFLGTLSNSLICLTVILKPKILSPRNIFIVNLAASDLLLCVFTMPFSFIEISMKMWQLGVVTCKLVAGLQATSIFVSTISITAIALDRYKVIVYPTHQEPASGGRSALLLLASVWIGALLLSLPLFTFRDVKHFDLPFEYDSIKSIEYCYEDWPFAHGRGIYSVISMMAQYVLPITIVSIVYAKISDKLQKRLIRRQRSTQLEWQQKRQLNLIRRTHTMLISVSLIFGLSWLPLNLVNVAGDFSDLFKADDQLFRIVFAVCHLIGCSSACSNPILYGYLNENFRKEFRQVYAHHLHRWARFCRRYLCCCACWCFKRARQSFNNVEEDDDDEEDDEEAAATRGLAQRSKREHTQGEGTSSSGGNQDQGGGQDDDEDDDYDEEDDDGEYYDEDDEEEDYDEDDEDSFWDEEGDEQEEEEGEDRGQDDCDESELTRTTTRSQHNKQHGMEQSSKQRCAPINTNNNQQQQQQQPDNESLEAAPPPYSQALQQREVNQCAAKQGDAIGGGAHTSAARQQQHLGGLTAAGGMFEPTAHHLLPQLHQQHSQFTLDATSASGECGGSMISRRPSYQTMTSSRQTLGRTMKFCLCISASSSSFDSTQGGAINGEGEQHPRSGSAGFTAAVAGSANTLAVEAAPGQPPPLALSSSSSLLPINRRFVSAKQLALEQNHPTQAQAQANSNSNHPAIKVDQMSSSTEARSLEVKSRDEFAGRLIPTNRRRTSSNTSDRDQAHQQQGVCPRRSRQQDEGGEGARRKVRRRRRRLRCKCECHAPLPNSPITNQLLDLSCPAGKGSTLTQITNDQQQQPIAKQRRSSSNACAGPGGDTPIRSGAGNGTRKPPSLHQKSHAAPLNRACSGDTGGSSNILGACARVGAQCYQIIGNMLFWWRPKNDTSTSSLLSASKAPTTSQLAQGNIQKKATSGSFKATAGAPASSQGRRVWLRFCAPPTNGLAAQVGGGLNKQPPPQKLAQNQKLAKDCEPSELQKQPNSLSAAKNKNLMQLSAQAAAKQRHLAAAKRSTSNCSQTLKNKTTATAEGGSSSLVASWKCANGVSVANTAATAAIVSSRRLPPRVVKHCDKCKRPRPRPPLDPTGSSCTKPPRASQPLALTKSADDGQQQQQQASATCSTQQTTANVNKTNNAQAICGRIESTEVRSETNATPTSTISSHLAGGYPLEGLPIDTLATSPRYTKEPLTKTTSATTTNCEFDKQSGSSATNKSAHLPACYLSVESARRNSKHKSTDTTNKQKNQKEHQQYHQAEELSISGGEPLTEIVMLNANDLSTADETSTPPPLPQTTTATTTVCDVMDLMNETSNQNQKYHSVSGGAMEVEGKIVGDTEFKDVLTAPLTQNPVSDDPANSELTDETKPPVSLIQKPDSTDGVSSATKSTLYEQELQSSKLDQKQTRPTPESNTNLMMLMMKSDANKTKQTVQAPATCCCSMAEKQNHVPAKGVCKQNGIMKTRHELVAKLLGDAPKVTAVYCAHTTTTTVPNKLKTTPATNRVASNHQVLVKSISSSSLDRRPVQMKHEHEQQQQQQTQQKQLQQDKLATSIDLRKLVNFKQHSSTTTHSLTAAVTEMANHDIVMRNSSSVSSSTSSSSSLCLCRLNSLSGCVSRTNSNSSSGSSVTESRARSAAGSAIAANSSHIATASRSTSSISSASCTCSLSHSPVSSCGHSHLL